MCIFGQHKKSGCINTILSSLRFFLLTSFGCLHSWVLSDSIIHSFISHLRVDELPWYPRSFFYFLFVLLSFEGILAFSLSVSINTQTILFPCWYGPKSDHRRISFHPIFQLLLSPTFVSFLFPFIGLFFRTCHLIIPSICSIFTCWTSIITPTFPRYQEVPSFNCAKMAESLINSPNSAQGNALGRSGFHNMDNLLNELAIPFDYSPYGFGTSTSDAVAKSYPFQLNQFQTPFPQYHYEPYYSLDDIQKFQVQLYQELRFQVVKNDLMKEEPFLQSFQEVDSTSGASTIDTPLPNTSVLSVPESILTPEFSLPLPESEMPKKRNLVDQTQLKNNVSASEPVPKKHTRKHIMARSRNGCWICRIKHLKCDERKPVCYNCVRFGIQCDYSPNRPDYVSDKELRRRKLDSITTKKRRCTSGTKPVRKWCLVSVLNMIFKPIFITLAPLSI